jgi:Na+-transporting NADH:ubiquinone oxidoreductase subunit A
MIHIKKGLDLPIAGKPDFNPTATIEEARSVRSVAILGSDYPGMRPTMEVREGEAVARGALLFTDKKNPGVRFTSPVSGRVTQINRGAKRALVSVVIELVGDTAENFGALDATSARALDGQAVAERLVASGLWPALRTRPYSKVPALGSTPAALFVTAMDTNPLAGNPEVVINAASDEFCLGLDLVSKLTSGPTYLCHSNSATVPQGTAPSVQAQAFAGIHPAGLPGTHIHHLDPVSANKTVWFIGYQDVIAIGQLFLQGSYPAERVVTIAGPSVDKPRMVRTLQGACLDELTAGELNPGAVRVISGSILSGHTAAGSMAYLGRYHNQVSAIPEDQERRLLGYLRPGVNSHSVFPIYLAKWFGKKEVSITTSSNGSPRGMVPIGTFEAVMPLDILPTQLLRSLLVGDVETAIALGCLELDEDDLALCTYACPGKYEYGPVLRSMLTQIEKEG